MSIVVAVVVDDVDICSSRATLLISLLQVGYSCLTIMSSNNHIQVNINFIGWLKWTFHKICEICETQYSSLFEFGCLCL